MTYEQLIFNQKEFPADRVQRDCPSLCTRKLVDEIMPLVIHSFKQELVNSQLKRGDPRRRHIPKAGSEALSRASSYGCDDRDLRVLGGRSKAPDPTDAVPTVSQSTSRHSGQKTARKDLPSERDRPKPKKNTLRLLTAVEPKQAGALTITTNHPSEFDNNEVGPAVRSRLHATTAAFLGAFDRAAKMSSLSPPSYSRFFSSAVRTNL